MKPLTRRQTILTELAAQGLGCKEIADQMGIAVNTARITLQQARERVGAKTVAHLVAISISRGFINAMCIALVVSSLLSPYDVIRSKNSTRTHRREVEVAYVI